MLKQELGACGASQIHAPPERINSIGGLVRCKVQLAKQAASTALGQLLSVQPNFKFDVKQLF